MFSIVIPLYNKAPYISKAIESVLAQTFQNFEIIVIDDGSTDGCLQEINKYTDGRLSIFSQTNAGVSAARNSGVKRAKFEFIAFLDADDWWNKYFLQEMAELINQFPEAKLYGSSYYIVKHGINKIPKIGVDPGFKAGYIDYFKVYSNTFWVPFNCSFVILQKSIFEQEGGFNQSLKFGEDFDLWARIALKEKVAYLNKPLSYSNQDVDIQHRAIGSGKMWKKEEHVTFNLDYLEKYRQNNSTLFYLLDGLKVRSLVYFYLTGTYHDDIKFILSTINWQKQPFFYKFIYNWPKWIVTIFFSVKSAGSTIKKIYNKSSKSQ